VANHIVTCSFSGKTIAVGALVPDFFFTHRDVPVFASTDFCFENKLGMLRLSFISLLLILYSFFILIFFVYNLSDVSHSAGDGAFGIVTQAKGIIDGQELTVAVKSYKSGISSIGWETYQAFQSESFLLSQVFIFFAFALLCSPMVLSVR
jgi:hypothetical protein